MELPNYNQQLLHQLYALCKEQQFCDCNILVGTVHFRAHKLVLAAASLLFKSLLDGTDTISIDASVVAPDDFALLLEMVYTGRLPLGKHNFTRVISAADNLQMLAVAASCKTLLRGFMSCSNQDQVLRDSISLQAVEAASNCSALPNSFLAAKLDAEVVVGPQESAGNTFGPADSIDLVSVEEPKGSVDETPNEAAVMLSRSHSQDSDFQFFPDSPGEPGSCHLYSSVAEPSEEDSGVVSQTEASGFLLVPGLTPPEVHNAQTVLDKPDDCEEIQSSMKEALVACMQSEATEPAFRLILARVQEGGQQRLSIQDAASLLKLLKALHPTTNAAEDQEIPSMERSAESIGEGETTAALLQEIRQELAQNGAKLESIPELLDAVEGESFSGTGNQAKLVCLEGSLPREAVEDLIKRVAVEKTPKAESLVKHLGPLKAPLPSLNPLLDNWAAAAARSVDTARWNLEGFGGDLLRSHHASLANYVGDPRLLQQGLSAAQHLAPGSREALKQIVTGAAEQDVFSALEGQRLSAVAIWQVLLALRETELPLKQVLKGIQDPDADLFFQTVGSSEGVATEILLRHGLLISETIRQGEAVEAELAKALEELLLAYPEEEPSTASWKAALSRALARPVPASQICQLLCSTKESFPSLQPVMQELQLAGLLTECDEGKAGGWKWKVNSELQQKAEPSGRPLEDLASEKSFVCKACRKNFHFYCRLKVHEKRCRAIQQVPCKECGEARSSCEELEKHHLEAHGGESSVPAKKRRKPQQRRLPVACDICGRKFAHASGMQYHKLTEHFDEKPFSCDACGAKFAANSTLKNHQRLHTGDRPYICKYCPTSFSQASALAYHTKKKHAEGKMYSCQYCSAIFAQSIELSRHVRTHTGDNPYVCRMCGRGFRQANGLSIHLRTFHNLDNPYDCKKCQLSFPTLQEHRKHIHAAHAREYHPCPTCSKVFSAPSLLERHKVTHIGGKPFSCKVCNKAYQQLSGLWYHNRTHHPEVFAAQNHRSSRFSSLQCGSCDKTFSSMAACRKHTVEMHAGSQVLCCPHCSASFHLQGALQHHIATEHATRAGSSFGCGLCGEPFSGWEQLEEHCGTEHPKVPVEDAQVPTAHIVQVIQTSEQVIALAAESDLAGTQVFLKLPDAQGSQGRTELVTVAVEDLLDKRVTLICEEAK